MMNKRPLWQRIMKSPGQFLYHYRLMRQNHAGRIESLRVAAELIQLYLR